MKLSLRACNNGMDWIPVTMETNPEVSLQMIRLQCLSDKSLDEILLRVLDDDFDRLRETSAVEGVSIHRIIPWGATLSEGNKCCGRSKHPSHHTLGKQVLWKE